MTLAAPIRWLQPSSDPTAAVETVHDGEWSGLPAIDRASGELELTAASRTFVAGLATRQATAASPAPLRGDRSLEAPRGLVRGIARVLDGGRHDGPELTPAPPDETGQRRHRTASEHAVPRWDSPKGEQAPDAEQRPDGPTEAVRIAASELPTPPRVLRNATPAEPGGTLTRVAEDAPIPPPSGVVAPAPTVVDRSRAPAAETPEQVPGSPEVVLPETATRGAPELTPNFRPRRMRGAFVPLPGVGAKPGPALISGPPAATPTAVVAPTPTAEPIESQETQSVRTVTTTGPSPRREDARVLTPPRRAAGDETAFTDAVPASGAQAQAPPAGVQRQETTPPVQPRAHRAAPATRERAFVQRELVAPASSRAAVSQTAHEARASSEREAGTRTTSAAPPAEVERQTPEPALTPASDEVPPRSGSAPSADAPATAERTTPSAGDVGLTQHVVRTGVQRAGTVQRASTLPSHPHATSSDKPLVPARTTDTAAPAVEKPQPRVHDYTQATSAADVELQPEAPPPTRLEPSTEAVVPQPARSSPAAAREPPQASPSSDTEPGEPSDPRVADSQRQQTSLDTPLVPARTVDTTSAAPQPPELPPTRRDATNVARDARGVDAPLVRARATDSPAVSNAHAPQPPTARDTADIQRQATPPTQNEKTSVDTPLVPARTADTPAPVPSPHNAEDTPLVPAHVNKRMPPAEALQPPTASDAADVQRQPAPPTRHKTSADTPLVPARTVDTPASAPRAPTTRAAADGQPQPETPTPRKTSADTPLVPARTVDRPTASAPQTPTTRAASDVQRQPDAPTPQLERTGREKPAVPGYVEGPVPRAETPGPPVTGDEPEHTERQAAPSAPYAQETDPERPLVPLHALDTARPAAQTPRRAASGTEHEGVQRQPSPPSPKPHRPGADTPVVAARPVEPAATAADVRRQPAGPSSQPHETGPDQPLVPARAPHVPMSAAEPPQPAATVDTRPQREPAVTTASDVHPQRMTPVRQREAPVVSRRTQDSPRSGIDVARSPLGRESNHELRLQRSSTPVIPVRAVESAGPRASQPADYAALPRHRDEPLAPGSDAGPHESLVSYRPGSALEARRPGLDLQAALSAPQRAAPVQRARAAVAPAAVVSAVPARVPGLDVAHALTERSAPPLLQLAPARADPDTAPPPAPTLAPGLVAVPAPATSPQPVQRVMSDTAPEEMSRERLAEAPDDELEELADRIYDHIRARFRTELLIDRERAGLLADRY